MLTSRLWLKAWPNAAIVSTREICPAHPVTKTAAAITSRGLKRSRNPRTTTPTPSNVHIRCNPLVPKSQLDRAAPPDASSPPKRGQTMIRVGIGGWIFEPWRGTFFPKGLPKTRELHHTSRAVTSIEINSTYYSAQKPETFRKWAEQTPDDFVFAVKASRFATNRRVLAEAGLSVERFVTQGITELKKKLGPILW